MTKESIYENNGNKIGGAAAEELERYFQRIENLQEEMEPFKSDIKDVFSEAKGKGYDTKIMRAILKLRKLDPAEREEQRELMDIYMRAVNLA